MNSSLPTRKFWTTLILFGRKKVIFTNFYCKKSIEADTVHLNSKSLQKWLITKYIVFFVLVSKILNFEMIEWCISSIQVHGKINLLMIIIICLQTLCYDISFCHLFWCHQLLHCYSRFEFQASEYRISVFQFFILNRLTEKKDILNNEKFFFYLKKKTKNNKVKAIMV